MKKIITLLVTLVLAVSLVACGGKTNEEEKVIKVAATAVPHAVILEKAKEILAKDGWDLQITIFNDYVQPIQVVESGEMDANYFAHVPYLDNYNAENGASQVAVCKIHSEPLGIYTGKKTDLSKLEAGDEIAVPNDGTNETRALILLEQNGVLTLPEGTTVDSLVTAKDIVSYNVEGVKIVELEAANIPHVLDDLAFAALNGNYAMEAKITDRGIAFEAGDSDLMVTYVNVLACKDGNQNNPGIVALANCLRSDEIKSFIKSEYNGTVIFYEGN